MLIALVCMGHCRAGADADRACLYGALQLSRAPGNTFLKPGLRDAVQFRDLHFCRQHERPSGKLASLRIYEAHAGMSSEEPKVASYSYFKGKSSTPELSLQCCCFFLPQCVVQNVLILFHRPACITCHMRGICHLDSEGPVCACRQCPAPHSSAGIQRHPADGHSGACLLCLLWVSCDQPFRCLLALRHS